VSAELSRKGRTGRARLRQLIGEVLVDAYGADRQHGAFLVMLEDRVACPFRAICRRKGRTYRVGVTALEWADRPPVGAEWFDAYRAWLKGDL